MSARYPDRPSLDGRSWREWLTGRQPGNAAPQVGVPGPHRGRGPRGYVRADDRILEDVNERLYADPRLDASGVSVTVTAGEVTMNGSVPTVRGRQRAEAVAGGVSGVSRVRNNLRVDSGRPDDPHGRGTTVTPTPANVRAAGRPRRGW